MAEIGIITSIIGVAAIGVKVAKTLYTISERAASANTSIKRVATNVSLFTVSLKHFAAVMKDTDELQKPEIQDAAQKIVEECLEVFKDLQKSASMAMEPEMHSPDSNSQRKRRFSFNNDVINRIMRTFRQEKVDRLIAQLEYLKSTAMVLCQTMTLALATRKAKAMDDMMHEMIQQFSELKQLKEEQQLEQTNRQKQLKAQEEVAEQERSHVEVLIVACQFNFNILQQFFPSPYGRSSTDGEIGHISASDSESSVESSTQKFIEGPPSPLALVPSGLQRGGLAFLQRQPRADAVNQTTPTVNNEDLVDQLLARFTRLPEFEIRTNRRRQSVPESEKQAAIPEGADVTPPRVDSEKEKDAQEDRDMVSPVTPPPPAYAPTSSSTASSSSSTGPKKSAAGSTTSKSSAAPPNKEFATLAPPPTNTKLARTKGVSAADIVTTNPPLHSVEVRGLRDGSPMPSRPRVPNQYLPQPLTIPRAIMDPPSNTRQPIAAIEYYPYSEEHGQSGPRTYDPRYQAHVSDDESEVRTPRTPLSDSDDENEPAGLGIPWRLRVHDREWSYLDTKLIGPRTPFLPEPPDQRDLRNAITILEEGWVSERALREKRYSFKEIVDRGGGFDRRRSEQKRWCIAQPLTYEQVNELVERTIHIHKRDSAEVRSPTVAGGRPDQTRPPARHASSQQTVRFADHQLQPTVSASIPYPPGPAPMPPRSASYDSRQPYPYYSPTHPGPLQPTPWGMGPSPGPVPPPQLFVPGSMPPFVGAPRGPRMGERERERSRGPETSVEKKKRRRSERNSKYVKTMGKIAALATALDALDSL